ncbi:MAG: tRNA pseudouridine55 synthase [Chloroflexota bacterium]|nr:tRNA pseudouridine55 synthase [Chloroflexota bacterium]
MDLVGVLCVDKPAGMTSAAVVGTLRRSSGTRRVGHGGTLDPAATGVLPVFFGRATVLADHLSAQGKSYRAGIRLGAGSTTDDAEGELTPAALPVGLTQDTVVGALAGFVGDIMQRPPAYSALKVDGVRSYRRVRRGEGDAPLPPRPARVDRAELVRVEAGGDGGPLAVVDIDCGPGFYVRALARDLGEALGTRAHLESLVRTRVGALALDDAVSLDAAVAAGEDLALLPVRDVVRGWAAVRAEDGVEDLLQGRAVAAPGAPDGPSYAQDGAGRVLAIGEVRDGSFHPRRLVEL